MPIDSDRELFCGVALNKATLLFHESVSWDFQEFFCSLPSIRKKGDPDVIITSGGKAL